ncbi:endopeptidase La [Helicobacter himalayensis]|uniref:endopeptidase La n=1 Tax=Helicobacter himalayensis TaxID=1591088 RepID=UPI003D6FF184
MKENIEFPLVVPILVQDDLFIYPFMIAPVYINDDENVQAVDKAMEGNDLILISSPKDSESSDEALYDVGVLGSIMRKVAMPDGKTKLLFQGLYRAKIEKIISDNPLQALVDVISYEPYEENTANALLEILREKVKILANTSQRFPPDLLKTIEDNHEPNRIIDLVASSMRLKKEHAYKLFAQDSVLSRLELIIEYVMEEIQAQRIQKEIKSKVHNKMEQINKEYFLKEQLKLIQKELGENPKDEEIERYKQKLEALRPAMNEDAYKEIKKQIERLSRMHQDSADANLLQNYVEWCLEIPFDKQSKTKISISTLQKQLDSDHYALKKPKERIIEYFAVRELSSVRKKDSKGSKGTILCFFGPPGVGKTSLANSIAKATKRSLVRIALGGLEDVSELRGHRRTYIGAMPGRITQGLIEAKEMNPVIVLDEIDKVAKNYRGDPTSALLEILDPEQNSAFRDYYTNFNLDLSRVIFIATANDIGTIPPPLRDRMEFIEISSYTPQEKFQIARKYLIPQELEKHALKSQEVALSSEALKEIIEKYTREAGVRGLRRQIASIMRKSAKEILSKKEATKISITPRNVGQFLEKIVFEISPNDAKDKIGVTNGLAWTSVGGDVLKIEAIKIKGKGALTLTGSMGDVMKESAKIAHSVVKTLFDKKFLQNKKQKLPKDSQIYTLFDIHLHIPEGATPKDGPSAGITMACTIASILSERKVRAQIAMTGELTLTGAVLPIGGLKEKLIAAHKAGIKKVLIPRKNYERDLGDIEQEVKENMEIVGVDTMQEVLELALV